MGTLSSRVVLAALLAACSPEAVRTRDGGPGGDPNNKVLVESRGTDPRAADTTLWPGRALEPVERFARGQIPPPTYPASRPPAPTRRDTTPSADARKPGGEAR